MAIWRSGIGAIAWLAATAGVAAAQGGEGPYPWQMKLQEPVTQIMEFIVWFNWYTLVIVTAITLFVTALVAYCIYRFHASRNPVPSRVSHNTLVEVLWTVIPVFVLVAIAVPSFRLLYGQYDPAVIYEDFDPETTPFLTVKITGYQWYWGFEYAADEDGAAVGVAEPLTFDAIMVPDDQLGENGIRNLSVDNPLVVPVNTFVRAVVTAGDVLHSFGMPSFGVKIDAVPGRLNETYFRVEREGLYYGQCSELCGKDHAFMPVAVRVVSEEQFRAWAAQAGTDLPGAYQTLAASIDADKNTKVAAR